MTLTKQALLLLHKVHYISKLHLLGLPTEAAGGPGEGYSDISLGIRILPGHLGDIARPMYIRRERDGMPMRRFSALTGQPNIKMFGDNKKIKLLTLGYVSMPSLVQFSQKYFKYRPHPNFWFMAAIA